MKFKGKLRIPKETLVKIAQLLLAKDIFNDKIACNIKPWNETETRRQVRERTCTVTRFYFLMYASEILLAEELPTK